MLRLNLIKPECPKGARLIPLTQGKYAIVDAEDYDRVNAVKWTFTQRRGRSDGYAYRQIRNRTVSILMHRLVAQTPAGMDTDHINQNKLDNRKQNLRHVDRSHNNANAPKRKHSKMPYKGIKAWGNKFCAQITFKGTIHKIGVFAKAEDAAKAYDDAARRFYGESACVNFGSKGND